MSGLDGAFLHLETPSTPMHVATLYLIDPLPAATGDFGSEIRRRLLPRLAPAPFFPSRLAPMPLHLANLVWIDGGIPDFSQHLRRIVLPSAAGFGELEACVSGCTRPCSIVDTVQIIKGMGHDLPPGVQTRLLEAIVQHCRVATTPGLRSAKVG